MAGAGVAYVVWGGGGTVPHDAAGAARPVASPAGGRVNGAASTTAVTPKAEAETLAQLRGENERLSLHLEAARKRFTEMNEAASKGVTVVRDALGRPILEYDAKNRVLTYDRSKSVLLEGDGKILVGRRDEIAGGRKSEGAAVEATLKFENERNEDVFLFWIDYGGNPIPYDRVKPGGTSERGTYMGHQWVVTDMNGHVLGNIEPELPKTTEVIPVR